MVGTVLVTGAAGFVGRRVVARLQDEGWSVRAVDLGLPSSHPAGLPPDPAIIRADVRDGDRLAELVEGIDAVCHQAGMVGLSTDWRDAVDYVSHNAVGTATLLRALHHRGFNGRFVLASSMVVYGEGAYRCPRHGSVRPPPRLAADLAAGRYEAACPDCGGPVAPQAIGEDAPSDPRNVYAATKLHQEHLCRAFARDHEMPLFVLRYHNVYGPGMPRDTPYAGVASIFRSALAAGEAPRVFEDGAQLRDLVHVDDVARANVLALSSPAAQPGTMNIASGQPRTVLELATALWETYAETAPPPRVVGGARAGDVRHIFGATEQARALIGFEAQIDFVDGMRELALDESGDVTTRVSASTAP